jgi:hypothetical protein
VENDLYVPASCSVKRRSAYAGGKHEENEQGCFHIPTLGESVPGMGMV